LKPPWLAQRKCPPYLHLTQVHVSAAAAACLLVLLLAATVAVAAPAKTKASHDSPKTSTLLPPYQPITTLLNSPQKAGRTSSQSTLSCCCDVADTSQPPFAPELPRPSSPSGSLCGVGIAPNDIWAHTPTRTFLLPPPPTSPIVYLDARKYRHGRPARGHLLSEEQRWHPLSETMHRRQALSLND
jgi:hypothetical protein